MQKLNETYRHFLSNKFRDNPVVFNWLFLMTVVTIPFPDYSLTSKFMIALGVYWLFFFGSFKAKMRQLRHTKLLWLSISFLYLLPVFGLTYSNDLPAALTDLVIKLPFLILPIIVFSSSEIVDIKQVHKYFSYAVAILSLSALLQALYLKFHFGVDYMFYHEFSFFTEKHTTYFGLFLTLALLFFVDEIFQKKKIVLHTLLLFFILYMMYINGNRMSFVASFLGIMILTFAKLNLKKILLILLSFIVLAAFFTQTNFYQNRIKTQITQSGKHNQIRLRKLHWTAVWQTIRHNNLILGAGTESHRDYLYQKYKDLHYEIAYLEHYNAHNQFLETTLDFGFLGLFLLVLAIGFHLYLIIKSKNWYLLALYISIVVFMLTESILERQSGIVIFSLFVSLMLLSATKNKY